MITPVVEGVVSTPAAATPAVTARVAPRMDGALMIRKETDISSFGVIEKLQKQYMRTYGVRFRELPKLGHGGTLDPFATGLLAVCVGRAVKLARYFLGSTKGYDGMIRFGQTTEPGDPTAPVSETSDHLPASIEELRALAAQLEKQPYLQTPPMHSAKKKDGRPLYELAREGITVERDPKLCQLYSFRIEDYTPPTARFTLVCSTGTYVRTLAQDYARMLGTVGMLDTLNRSFTGAFETKQAWTVGQIEQALLEGKNWDELPCWVPFDQLLDGYQQVECTETERQALINGKQAVVPVILARLEPKPTSSIVVGQEGCVAITCQSKLTAIARLIEGKWELERVFVPGE